MKLTISEHDFIVNTLYKTIKAHCKGEETVILPNYKDYRNNTYIPDLYLGKGCKDLGIEPETAIEFKLFLRPDTVYVIGNMMERHRKQRENELHIKNIWIVYYYDTPYIENVKKKVREQVGNLYESIQIKKINEILKEDFWEDNNLELKETDWKAIREERMAKAQKLFREGRNTFFLGAGVSMSMGLPSWADLLKNILDKPHSNPDMKSIKSGDYDSINEACGYSSIITGRYATMGIADIEETIQKVLYKDVKNDSSPLLDAIQKAAPNLDSIITYNFDDLVETAFDKANIANMSIYGKNRCFGKELPIYHVHGMIPQTKAIASTAILSEQAYHALYREAYHWANVEQLHALERNTCFFIGLSMTDPSLRRLLDISQSEEIIGQKQIEKDEPHHFAFLSRTSFKHGCENCPDCIKNTEHFDIIERMMLDLGISIIWFEGFDELPQCIEEVCVIPNK